MAFPGLNDLPVDHVGIAVHDVDEAMARYGRLFGITSWRRIEFTALADRGDSLELITGIAATGSLGTIGLEVVAPRTGRWTVNDVLETRGESVFHLGYRVDDVRVALGELLVDGLTSDVTGVDVDGVPRFAYLDSAEPGALMIELVSASMPPSFFLDAAGLGR